jgi:hypothetical protein
MNDFFSNISALSKDSSTTKIGRFDRAEILLKKSFILHCPFCILNGTHLSKFGGPGGPMS